MDEDQSEVSSSDLQLAVMLEDMRATRPLAHTTVAR